MPSPKITSKNQKTASPKKPPLRVGFDLDGVILYNPARIIRRPITLFKHFFIPKEEKRFRIPHNNVEKSILKILHLSSFIVSPGFHIIHHLSRKGIIEPYVITARYSFLKDDYEKWAKKLNFPIHFKGHYMNDKDEQPHEFKERMIKKLNLDVFVEDNLNIVEHLNKTTDAHVLWIYNIFDTFVKYDHKFRNLKNAVMYIQTYARKKNRS